MNDGFVAQVKEAVEARRYEMKVPQDLVEKIAGGKVLLFLGSETVVRTKGGQVRPSWLQITSLLAQRCGYSEPDISLAKVAQYFEMTQGRHALITAIADVMADPSYVPAPVHRLIAQLPIKFIVTTNIDTLLEQALWAVGRWPQVVLTITDAAGLDAEKTTVVKLFGDIERKDIVITEDDHYEYEQRSPMMADLIRQRLVSNTLLFVNCDLDDVRLKSMIAQVTQRLGRLKGRSYAVDPSPSDYRRRFWEDKETHIIEADAQTFLEDLLAALEAYEVYEERVEEEPEIPLRGRPFKRLDYYTEEDAGIFYGREDETKQLISSILAHQLLVLVGASGTGKTSLLLAGAKPALERGELLVAYTRVMGDPLTDLRASVERAVGVPLGPGSLRDQLSALEAGQDLVIFLDQFEEFFLPRFGQAVQQPFVGELARCLESRSVRTRFVISLRSEALINLLSFKSEIPYIVNNTLELQPLSQEQAARAITQPLKRFGVTLEESLLEQIVDDLDEEGINPPQLQIVSDRLYDRVLREPEPEITRAIYEELGGADTILGEYLDEVLEKLDKAQRRLAQVVLQALVTEAGTKEPRSLAQITGRTGLPSNELEGILGELDRLRLVRALKFDSEVRYELVLDYLAERIPGWLEEPAEWRQAIMNRLLTRGEVQARELDDVPKEFRAYAVKRFVRENPQMHLSYTEDKLSIALVNAEQIVFVLRGWDSIISRLSRSRETGIHELPRIDLHERRAVVNGVVGISKALAALLGTSINGNAVIDGKFVSGLWLDIAALVEGPNLPSRLPCIFMVHTELTNADVTSLRNLLERQVGLNQRVALLLVFDDSLRIEKVRSLLHTRMKQVYAYDVVIASRNDLVRIIVAMNPRREFRRLILRHVDLISVSPFVITGPTPDNVFFGREPEIREIVQHSLNASFAVIGGRRVGKSSLLYRLHRLRLPAAGFQTLYYDCSITPTCDAFLAAAIHDWRPEPPPNAPASFGDLFRSPPTERPLVLLLDEADKLIRTDRENGWQLYNALRALANSGLAQFVLSGERTLRDALRDPESPLFNFANEMLIGRLDFRAVEELVSQPMKQLEIELANEVGIIQRIWEFTSGHPNVVQRVCRRLIEHLNERGTRHIALDDVRAVIEDPEFQEIDFLQTYWEGATPLERIITLVLSQEARTYRLKEVRQLLSDQAHIQPTATATKDALGQLVDLRSILKRSQAGYAFAVEAFPRVLANTTTVEDLLEVLVEQYKQTEAQA